LVSSMTGYGRGEYSGAGKHITVEVKAVNHRFLEVSVRIPRYYAMLEDRLRKRVRDLVARGYLELFCNIEDDGEKMRQVKVDKDLAVAYYNALKELGDLLDISPQIQVYQLAQMPSVLAVDNPVEDLESLWPVLEEALLRAVAALVQMRKVEGERLVRDLVERQQVIATELEAIERQAPVVVEEYRQRLQARVEELQQEGKAVVDESRLATEVAMFADRCNIQEEIVRLRSHLTQFGQEMTGEGPVGRKLDFLVQEMFREINTIGSKANNLEISRRVVKIKGEIEKLREQIQNIE